MNLLKVYVYLEKCTSQNLPMLLIQVYLSSDSLQINRIFVDSANMTPHGPFSQQRAQL